MNIDPAVEDLVESIRKGRCVAFVGAGLLQPSLPGWEGLLWRLAGQLEVGDTHRTEAEEWLRQKPLQRRDFEGLGELLRKALGAKFFPALKRVLSDPLSEETRKRLRLLDGMPFHYVLTTNFAHHLGQARLPDKDAYAHLATAETRDWAHTDFWDVQNGGCLWQGRVMALHGSLEQEEGLIFNARSYRELLHGRPAYRAILRTLFATRNILFIGFSFADAYVDDLRSEILSMIGLGETARGLRDYAILPDLNAPLRTHLSANESLEVLHYSTKVGDKLNEHFGGFDDWLRVLHAHTNPAASLAARLRGARILWCDAVMRNNERGFQALRGGPIIVQVATPEEALAAVGAAERRGEPFDVIVTHWGHATQAAITLLNHLRAPRPPVVVFASGYARAANRTKALRHGAIAYTATWSELFEVLDSLLTDGGRAGFPSS